MQTEFIYDCASRFVLLAYKFTGKERDAESGLDFFGARYYASSMGRFMSPDWSSRPSAVPYSNLTDPQSLNLYEYVGNNPLSRMDADGHVWDWVKKLGNLFTDADCWCSGAQAAAATRTNRAAAAAAQRQYQNDLRRWNRNPQAQIFTFYITIFTGNIEGGVTCPQSLTH
jgi:RHS repeat-associated protein